MPCQHQPFLHVGAQGNFKSEGDSYAATIQGVYFMLTNFSIILKTYKLDTHISFMKVRTYGIKMSQQDAPLVIR